MDFSQKIHQLHVFSITAKDISAAWMVDTNQHNNVCQINIIYYYIINISDLSHNGSIMINASYTLYQYVRRADIISISLTIL